MLQECARRELLFCRHKMASRSLWCMGAGTAYLEGAVMVDAAHKARTMAPLPTYLQHQARRLSCWPGMIIAVIRLYA